MVLLFFESDHGITTMGIFTKDIKTMEDLSSVAGHLLRGAAAHESYSKNGGTGDTAMAGRSVSKTAKIRTRTIRARFASTDSSNRENSQAGRA